MLTAWEVTLAQSELETKSGITNRLIHILTGLQPRTQYSQKPRNRFNGFVMRFRGETVETVRSFGVDVCTGLKLGENGRQLRLSTNLPLPLLAANL